MSQFPQVVVADIDVTWPPQAVPPMVMHIRRGTWVDIPPSNAAMIAAYGGVGNLRAPTAGELGDSVCSREALSN